jgi:hypothetical protein
VLAVLQRFPAYTYSSLMNEDAELIRLLNRQSLDQQAAELDDEGW